MSDDPNGVLEKPDTAPMQAIADGLRGLMVAEGMPAVAKPTLDAGCQLLELTADWLMDQHRMLVKQTGMMDAQNAIIVEQQAMIARLMGDE